MTFSRRPGRLVVALGLVASLAALVGATGFVSVAPGEVAVVRRLGHTLSQPWTPGLHLALPLGLDRVDRVRIDEVRRLSLGLARVPGPDDPPGAGEFLTGDRNLLTVHAVVQYRVSDPKAFVLQAGLSQPPLSLLAESSLSRTLASRPIDAALRSERAEVALEVLDDLSRAVERLNLGITILSISLTDARPPPRSSAGLRRRPGRPE